VARGWLDSWGCISLIAWDHLSFKWRWEEKDLEELVEGEEGETTTFALSCTGRGISIFNLLLAYEDWTGETTRPI